MSRDFLLPDVGEGLEEAEIVEWHVEVGDHVVEDQVLVGIETAKSIVEISSPFDGVVEALGAPAGGVVEVGSLLVRFSGSPDGMDAPTAAPATAGPGVDEGQPTRPASREASSPPPAVSAQGGPGRVKAAPAVRRRAAEAGVPLGDVRGTGPGGRVTQADLAGWLQERPTAVEAEEPAASSPAGSDDRTGPVSRRPTRAGETVPLRGLRRQVARNMVQSWTTIPHVFDFREVDATALVALRATLGATDARPAIGILPFIVKATAAALRLHPYLNCSLDEENGVIELHGRIDIGIATSTSDGLLVPVVRACDEMTLAETSAEIARVVDLARSRTAPPDVLQDGTYTVNNLGALNGIGSLQSTPLIRPPESGILAFGRIHDRVVARDGQAVVLPTMFVTSAADHRVVDGDGLLAFTDTVVRYLQDPVLLLEGLR